MSSKALVKYIFSIGSVYGSSMCFDRSCKFQVLPAHATAIKAANTAKNFILKDFIAAAAMKQTVTTLYTCGSPSLHL